MPVEPLDQDIPKHGSAGKTLGLVAGIAYAAGGLASFFIYYSYWLSLSTLEAAGAPDATDFARWYLLTISGQAALLLLLLIGLICQRIAFARYRYCARWLWQVMLASSLLAAVAGFLPLNIIALALVTATLLHLFGKKEFYFEDKTSV